MLLLLLLLLFNGENGIGGDDSTKEVGRGRESMVRSVCYGQQVDNSGFVAAHAAEHAFGL